MKRTERPIWRVGLPAIMVALTLALLSPLSSGLALAAAPVPEAVSTDAVTSYGEGYRFDQDGWIYLHLEGGAHERGKQHGYLVAPELQEALRVAKFKLFWDTGHEWSEFVQVAEESFTAKADAEWLDEIKGIAEGAQEAGVDVSWQEVLAWNGYYELVEYHFPTPTNDNEHCSAFIATGSFTKGGLVVMAHNSWDMYDHAQFANAVLDIEPDQGHRILMQSTVGRIHSGTDFFVTDAGIMGTETTIGGYDEYDPSGTPEFFRVRSAMQYADNLDDFVAIMLKDNNGGYANSWLLADTHSGEIMRFELGLKLHSVERTKDGYYLGFNAASDIKLRALETKGAGYDDIRMPAGARRVRLTQLMKQYAGQIDVEIAKQILADHYDVYLEQEKPGSRSIEGRYDLDRFEYWAGRTPYVPKGAVDGKVMDSDMARKLSFWARWGSSSGLPFDASDFLAAHPQYDYLEGYLKDRPTQPWSLFRADQAGPAAAQIEGPGAAGVVRIDGSYNGGSVQLTAGQELEVVLEGNPTTGFQWEVGSADAAVLRQTGDWDFAPSSDLTGAGGLVTLHFKAVAAGETLLQLVYLQPWDKETPPAETFSVRVVVGAAQTHGSSGCTSNGRLSMVSRHGSRTSQLRRRATAKDCGPTHWPNGSCGLANSAYSTMLTISSGL
jgi:predicted secreted protein